MYLMMLGSAVLIIFTFYFTLTFMESLKGEDKRIIKQSKRAAIICLTLALGLLIITIPSLV